MSTAFIWDGTSTTWATNHWTRPTFAVITADTTGMIFTVAGDQTLVFPVSSHFQVLGSTGNDAHYIVLVVSFDTTNTLITVALIVDATGDGSLTPCPVWPGDYGSTTGDSVSIVYDSPTDAAPTLTIDSYTNTSGYGLASETNELTVLSALNVSGGGAWGGNAAAVTGATIGVGCFNGGSIGDYCSFSGGNNGSIGHHCTMPGNNLKTGGALGFGTNGSVGNYCNFSGSNGPGCTIGDYCNFNGSADGGSVGNSVSMQSLASVLFGSAFGSCTIWGAITAPNAISFGTMLVIGSFADGSSGSTYAGVTVLGTADFGTAAPSSIAVGPTGTATVNGVAVTAVKPATASINNTDTITGAFSAFPDAQGYLIATTPAGSTFTARTFADSVAEIGTDTTYALSVVNTAGTQANVLSAVGVRLLIAASIAPAESVVSPATTLNTAANGYTVGTSAGGVDPTTITSPPTNHVTTAETSWGYPGSTLGPGTVDVAAIQTAASNAQYTTDAAAVSGANAYIYPSANILGTNNGTLRASNIGTRAGTTNLTPALVAFGTTIDNVYGISTDTTIDNTAVYNAGYAAGVLTIEHALQIGPFVVSANASIGADPITQNADNSWSVGGKPVVTG